MPTSDGKYRVLALDGGGVRGLLTLEVLAFIESCSNKRLCDLFDLIVGTSTGGLLALALTREEPVSARVLSETYRNSAAEIFKRSTGQKLKSFAQLAGPKYSNASLYSYAYRVLGGATKLGVGSCPAMVTTYDLKRRTPRFYSTWDTPDVLRLDAAMSTCAAPTYFEPWHDNIDGGVCDNNPALSGVIELCKKFSCTVRDVIVCSVGTGSDMVSYEGAQAKGWGLLSWAEPLVSIFTDGTAELHAYHLKRLLRDEDVYRYQTNVTGSLAAMDNTETRNLDALIAAGAGLVTREFSRLNAMIDRLEA